MASAISVGMMLTVLSVLHNWLADQFFIIDDAGQDDELKREVFDIPVTFQSSEAI